MNTTTSLQISMMTRQFTGKVISMEPVIGNISRLMTRTCYEVIESRFAWDSLIRFNSLHEFLQELLF